MADERLLPAGIRDERSLALLSLLDRLDALDLTRLLIYGIDGVEASALPHLGWQFHVMGAEGWELAVSEGQRRALIKRALELHRYKGTRWAVRQALDALGVSAEIIEWFEPEAADLAPYEFGLLARIRQPVRRDELLGAETSDAVRRAVSEYKNARSHLAWIAFAVDLEIPLGPIEPVLARLSVDRSRLRVDWFPVFDITATDAAALDPDPFVQRREVIDVSPAPVLMGRPHHLDRGLPEAFADTGLQMDLVLPYAEGAWTAGIELVQRTSVTAAALPALPAALAASAVVSPVTGLDLAPVAASAAVSSAATSLAPHAVPPEGLDLMASFDAVAADFVPLDLPMEAVHV